MSMGCFSDFWFLYFFLPRFKVFIVEVSISFPRLIPQYLISLRLFWMGVCPRSLSHWCLLLVYGQAIDFYKSILYPAILQNHPWPMALCIFSFLLPWRFLSLQCRGYVVDTSSGNTVTVTLCFDQLWLFCDDLHLLQKEASLLKVKRHVLGKATS